MTFERPSKKVSESTQELRLATTMTGGVSLAIWMAGVAREINLLAQASQWRRVVTACDEKGEDCEPPSTCGLSPEAVASLKLYAHLLNLLDVVVDVDILSGTSAGGINAALLASSRVTGKDLGKLRELWLDLGSLLSLLRDPQDDSAPSLLYGDERLFRALAEEIPRLATGPFPPTKFPGSLRKPVTTVYITTTLLSGETSRFTDSFGTTVQDVDRRGLFTFTQEELATPGTTLEALALAARSSASFPAAFEPSFLPFGEPIPERGGVPMRPDLQPFTNITRAHWAADGGLLDNQPIGVLLKRVFDQPASRPVRRVLLFVVPSSGPAPDLVAQAPPDDIDQPLGLLEGLMKDLAAMTTQSIAADLRTIREHQDRMRARTDARLRLAEFATRLLERDDPNDRRANRSRLLTQPLLTDYAHREATTQAQPLVDALLRQLSTWAPASSSATDKIPERWEAELAIGGHGEELCRQRITDTILHNRSRPSDYPLPDTTEELARYGQPAYNLAKACALSIIQAAYQLASSDTDLSALAGISAVIHQRPQPTDDASEPPPPVNNVELVRLICHDPDVRAKTLGEAAERIANQYLGRSGVLQDDWERLGGAFANKNLTLLQRLAGPPPPTLSSQANSRRCRDDVSAHQLATYLNYLADATDSRGVALKLFDLAVTQRAMLPASADIEQSLELVQVSADTRSLHAPRFRTAQHKLTGMQLHHFGAFYKRSWRANDWMWGRLDGAGWLVHVLLDPRRVQQIVSARGTQPDNGANQAQNGVDWFIGELRSIGAPEFPNGGFPLTTGDEGSEECLTEDAVRQELAFLENPDATIPDSIPKTSLWLAHVWQQRILDEELDGLATAVTEPESKKTPSRSPETSLVWAENVKRAAPGPSKYAWLNTNPVAEETFASDQGSPLMAQTLTKAAATAAAAAGSVRQLPSVLKPLATMLRTLTLAGYRMVTLSRGAPKWSIRVGAALLVLGVAAAVQNSTVVGLTGLVIALLGAYLVALGSWQSSGEPTDPARRKRFRRLLVAIFSITVTAALLSLATPAVRDLLFGDSKTPGFLGSHLYWLGTRWWRPFIVILAIAVLVGVGRWTRRR